MVAEGIGKGRRSFLDKRVQRARKRAPERWGPKGGKATVGNYSTVKSALRLSATLSIRPSGRVQSIDMFWGSILVSKDITSGLSELAHFLQNDVNACVSSALSARSVLVCERERHRLLSGAAMRPSVGCRTLRRKEQHHVAGHAISDLSPQ